MNRRCALLIVAGLVALGPVADAQTFSLTDEERAWLDDHPVIRVAPAPNFPPMEYFDDQNVYRGVMADYAKILETRLGIKFEIAQYEAWQDVVAATKAREVDVWMEAQDTPERREYLNIAPPYVHLPVVILVRREMRGQLELADLIGLKVAVIEKGAEVGAPKYMEWYAAFGLLVTLVWLYLEILRLLAKLNSRR